MILIYFWSKDLNVLYLCSFWRCPYTIFEDELGTIGETVVDDHLLDIVERSHGWLCANQARLRGMWRSLNFARSLRNVYVHFVMRYGSSRKSKGRGSAMVAYNIIGSSDLLVQQKSLGRHALSRTEPRHASILHVFRVSFSRVPRHARTEEPTSAFSRHTIER